MMKKIFQKIWPVICKMLFVGGLAVLLFFAYHYDKIIEGLLGVALSMALAPIVHELGHVVMCKISKLQCVYVKFFCFCIQRKGNKNTCSLISPFAVDQTQMIPTSGENIKSRAIRYTLGGLLFSGVAIALMLIAAILVCLLGECSFFIFGLLPYTVYLFLMNILPLEYPIGKTDMLIYKGIKTNADAERTMLAAMEIQGKLYEGARFSEIDPELYFNLPQLCEDEPLFASITDLRYRYFLDVNDMEKAAEYLNRLAQVQEYFSREDLVKVAIELVYMHSITGNLDAAEQNLRICETFEEQAVDVALKRALAAYYQAKGDRERSHSLRAEGLALCEKEEIKGYGLFEKNLLQRIS